MLLASATQGPSTRTYLTINPSNHSLRGSWLADQLTNSIIMTPGGGGYGPPGDDKQVKLKEDYERNWKKSSIAGRLAEWESSS